MSPHQTMVCLWPKINKITARTRQIMGVRQTHFHLHIRTCLERHALALKLCYPCFHAAFSLVIFVVLIIGKTKELTVLLTFGLRMLVAVSRHVAKHLCASGRKGGVELLDRIAKIVPIAD